MFPECILLLAVDISSTLPLGKDQERVWQEKLIRLAFAHIPEKGLNQLRKKGNAVDNSDFCTQWRGIACHNHSVSSFFFSHMHVGNFNISALPHTISYLSVKGCRQKYEIQTRTLPRQVQTVILEQNQIFGRIDMTTLPPMVMHLYFADNRMTGPVDLTQLPDILEIVDLRSNRIRQDTAYYGELPRNLKYIAITDFQNSSNRINEYRAIYPEHRTKNPNVFPGISREKIF